MKRYTFVDYSTQAYSAVVALLILLFHNGTVPAWPWLFSAHVAGLVLIHLLIARQSGNPASKALDFFRHFYPVILYGAFFCETGLLNRMFLREYLDPALIRWDQTLFGCQPGVVFMQKLPWLVVSEAFYASYFSYYLMIGGMGLALLLRNRLQFFHYVSVVSFFFYLCYLTYIVLPTIGPQTMTGQAPGYVLPPDLQQYAVTDAYPEAVKGGVFFKIMAGIYRVAEMPGAAFPSSHVAVALCTVFFSFRYLRPIRYPHLALTLLLCLSTMYCHYHYAVDVIGGLLTAALLLPLGNWLYFKVQGSEPKAQSPTMLSAIDQVRD